jgi:hypothetical protein
MEEQIWVAWSVYAEMGVETEGAWETVNEG